LGNWKISKIIIFMKIVMIIIMIIMIIIINMLMLAPIIVLHIQGSYRYSKHRGIVAQSI